MQEKKQYLVADLPIAAAIILILAAAYSVYWPGLKGGFLFDDFPNLSRLGMHGEINDWASIRGFILGGIAGPLGRPISLASFLIDDHAWPSSAYGFKLTNLHVHLLTGLVLCWATLLLARLSGFPERQAAWIAVLNMGFWLLHPYMVSTTLYVVQRMAQLAALFMFAGLVAYLHGRLLLLKNRPHIAYTWMSLGVIVGTGLAAFSKENGVLLPLLILTIEFCLRAGHRMPRADWRWQAIFLWVPALAVLYMLAKEISFSSDPWPARSFNQVERLMSEGRILCEYLRYLFIPAIEGRGLFQDGYPISRGWLQPITTLASALGLAVLLGLALAARKRYPFFCLAVLFFFVAHLMESSVVGLELYFEHRNYVAAAFLFLPVAASGIQLRRMASASVVSGAYIAILALLAGLTWQRALLWADAQKLQAYWAAATPDSPRAQNFLAVQLFASGRYEQGMTQLDRAAQRLPESSLLTMQWLLQKVLYLQATQEDFKIAEQRLAQQRFDAQAVMGLRLLVEELIQPGRRPEYISWTSSLLDAMASNKKFHAVHTFQKMYPYLKGLLLLTQDDVESAFPLLAKAMDLQADTDAALSIVAHFGNLGKPVEALQMLSSAFALYQKQPATTLKRSQDVYNAEFERLRVLLMEDAERLEKSQTRSTASKK